MSAFERSWVFMKNLVVPPEYSDEDPCPVCGSTEPRGMVDYSYDENGEWIPIPPEFNSDNLCGKCYKEMDNKWRELEKPSSEFFQWPRDKDKTIEDIGWE